MTATEKLDAAIGWAKKMGWEDSWRPFVEDAFELIYNHAFVSYVWQGWYCTACDDVVPEGGIDSEGHDCIPLWEYHLKEMVVNKDPINYLYNSSPARAWWEEKKHERKN